MIRSAGEDLEQWIFHALLIGVQNNTTALENSLGVFNKTKYRPTLLFLPIIPLGT